MKSRNRSTKAMENFGSAHGVVELSTSNAHLDEHRQVPRSPGILELTCQLAKTPQKRWLAGTPRTVNPGYTSRDS